MSKLAERFFARFAGLHRTHGRYAIGTQLQADDKGKLTGPRGTRHEPYTVELWEGHLKGDFGIGVVPIMDSAMCVFGAIDIDDYTIDLKALNAHVRKLNLPLVVCRTKSGGAHLYLFTKEPVTAELMRTKLLALALAMGFPETTEVFPKQTRLASERDDGNWINMPYASGEHSTRYALDPKTGEALTPLQFLNYADKLAISESELQALELEIEEEEETDLFENGPPCLQKLEKQGFGDWQNNGLFNVGVYLRKRYGEDWTNYLEKYNQALMDPPVPSKDVMSTMKSVGKKSYSYMCKQEPICGVCDRGVCRTREFGVGRRLGDDPGVSFGPLVKLETDPPTWIFDVDGARMELTTTELMDQRKFQAKAIEVLNKWPPLIKPEVWKKIISEKLTEVEKVEVPVDATREGQLWVHLSRFCTSKVSGKALDELLMGKPFTDEIEGRSYFCSSDFMQYLTQHRVSGVSERELWRWLKRCKAEHHYGMVKGKGLNYWSVPAFEKQTEEFKVPIVEQKDAM